MKKFELLSILCLITSGSFAQFINNTGLDVKNSGLLVTNGDWTNGAGNIINNGIIRTNSSFINNGTLDQSSSGGFALDFSTDLAFQPGGSRMGFVTKNGTGIALITGTISVRDSLLIRNGLLQLMNATDTVALGSGATLLAGEKAYIQGGYIARSGAGNLLFPFGKDGIYLPLTMHKVQAQRVTASLLNAPATYQAGPGVDALINFPYVWTVVEKVATDTAGYVEINYPNTLPVVPNPIVVRQIPGQLYASMGARLINNSGTRTTVRSYSRRLNGTYSIARGFPSDPVTDSLALISLYTSTNGNQWTNRTNWRQGTIDTWFGISVSGQSITAVELPSNNLTGPVADQLVDILSLQTVNLSANKITAIPDFTLNSNITSLNVSDNNLDFGSLEPNAGIIGINYFIQGDIGVARDTSIAVGTSYKFELPSQGGNSQYQWQFMGQDIGVSTAAYVLPSIGRETMGEYKAIVTNPLFPGLILRSKPQKILAHATISGKLYADAVTAAIAGELTLYRVQPGAFTPVSTIPVATDGSYVFQRVLLDNYQVRGFADTITYDRALPTYYQSTIFWEEADTLKLVDNVSALDIISQLEPGPPSGRGSISGFLQEDDGTGRVYDIEKNRRVANAGVSARRVERTGRTKEEILTLVAYVFTNEDGEFSLPNLPAGEYRINFQYPGYPMDNTSYTTITIGTGFESQVMVAADVLNGKIHVTKLTITGLYEAANYHAEVFPNPAAEFIQLIFAGKVPGRTLVLTDLQGKSLHIQSAAGKEAALDVRDLRKGIYILQIREYGIKVKTLRVTIE